MKTKRRAVRDQNGERLTASVAREPDGTWGRTVWFGGVNGLGTNVRRYFYSTRATAMRGDISDEIGRDGRVA